MHRRGRPGALAGDFIIFSMSAKGINDAGSSGRLSEFLRMALKHDPVNLGDMKTGNLQCRAAGEIVSSAQDTSIVHAVFDDPGRAMSLLSDLGKAGLGTSVIISGLFEKTRECLRHAGLEPHTIEYSLGIRGRLDRLPPEGILSLTTMCGHGMVSASLVRRAVIEIKRGRRSAEAAARWLARPCECGVFNPARAERLLGDLARRFTLH
jgi:hypothetical protein